jgi:polyisoprenoid-binding protein YceI
MKIALGVLVLVISTVSAYVLSTGPDPVELVKSNNIFPEIARYRIDASQSKFIVHAFRGGIGYFKGHDHLIAAREFGGEAALNLDVLNPATLNMTVKATSLEETSDVFTAEQKGIIKKELNDLVLETAKYPDITFRSTNVKGSVQNGQFDVTIGGDLTLHGITRHIDIPATVSAEGETLHAKGQFKFNRKDFNVNATTAFHGAVRIKHELKFDFDIIARRA